VGGVPKAGLRVRIRPLFAHPLNADKLWANELPKAETLDDAGASLCAIYSC
jgi:hypothetical protein